TRSAAARATTPPSTAAKTPSSWPSNSCRSGAGGEGLVLGGPVGEAVAFLLDDGGRGVLHEGGVAELALALGDLRGDALELLVQARAFRVEVHESFQRHQQL